VISGGGGGYPGTVEFFNVAEQAVHLLRQSHPNLRAKLITGPLFTDWCDLKLAPRSSVIPFDPDLTATLAAADLVICQAGYNTIAELKQIATRCLVVPAPRRWDNQLARANKQKRPVRDSVFFRVSSLTNWRGQPRNSCRSLCLHGSQPQPAERKGLRSAFVSC
jgi:predicted glycosyltransferase